MNNQHYVSKELLFAQLHPFFMGKFFFKDITCPEKNLPKRKVGVDDDGVA